ncbi:DUF6482 family protein [Oceanospirillum beijerinckii]|uniref:DUF6482 family protein n=1 Tax=Oceanospirillum beijerinckii TaxID=64976 RepID=UPI0003F67444|nr:DUF6482 family protein [Oceanospirillum beijerinckii]MAC47326.1 hypothetical protein [Oceanospirillum sp.]
MRIKELKNLVESNADVSTRIETHATHNQYNVVVAHGGAEYAITNWRNKPLIFRSLDQATEALARAGIFHSVLVQHDGDKKILEVDTHPQLFLGSTPVSVQLG